MNESSVNSLVANLQLTIERNSVVVDVDWIVHVVPREHECLER